MSRFTSAVDTTLVVVSCETAAFAALVSEAFVLAMVSNN
jgi:hypothetical protein